MQRVGGFNGQMLDYIIENTFSHTPIPHIHTRTQTHTCVEEWFCKQALRIRMQKFATYLWVSFRREHKTTQHNTQIGFVFLLVKHDQNQCKTKILLSKFVCAANIV